jgi:hypothetical protein
MVWLEYYMLENRSARNQWETRLKKKVRYSIKLREARRAGRSIDVTTTKDETWHLVRYSTNSTSCETSTSRIRFQSREKAVEVGQVRAVGCVHASRGVDAVAPVGGISGRWYSEEQEERKKKKKKKRWEVHCWVLSTNLNVSSPVESFAVRCPALKIKMRTFWECLIIFFVYFFLLEI